MKLSSLWDVGHYCINHIVFVYNTNRLSLKPNHNICQCGGHCGQFSNNPEWSLWAEYEREQQLALDCTDSSLMSFSSSSEGSFTLVKGDEQQRLTQDHRRSTASISSLSSTLIAGESESDHSGCVAEQPSAEAGM